MPQVNLGKLSILGVRVLATALKRHGATEGYIDAVEEYERPFTEFRRQFQQQSRRQLSLAPIVVRHGPPEPHVHQIGEPQPQLADTASTLRELKRRLAKELYKLELDLQGGLRIEDEKGNKRPCDCASSKHNFGVEGTAEELMSYERNPLYGQVIQWYHAHLPEFEPAEIEKHPEAYYQALVPEIREFRKQVMGTESLVSMLSAQDKLKLTAKIKQLEEADDESSDGGDPGDGREDRMEGRKVGVREAEEEEGGA